VISTVRDSWRASMRPQLPSIRSNGIKGTRAHDLEAIDGSSHRQGFLCTKGIADLFQPNLTISSSIHNTPSGREMSQSQAIQVRPSVESSPIITPSGSPSLLFGNMQHFFSAYEGGSAGRVGQCSEEAIRQKGESGSAASSRSECLIV
jgi:hypothetical protein